jgi:hypothetical protein
MSRLEGKVTLVMNEFKHVEKRFGDGAAKVEVEFELGGSEMTGRK